MRGAPLHPLSSFSAVMDQSQSPFLLSLGSLVPPAPHALHHMCACSTSGSPPFSPTTPPNPLNSQFLVLRIERPAQPYPALRGIMSVGGGGLVTTPLSFLTGYAVSLGGQVKVSRDFLAVVLSCKYVLSLCLECRLRPHVLLDHPSKDLQRLRSSAMHRASGSQLTTRLAIEAPNQLTSCSIPAAFRLESSGVLGTLPSPSLRSTRLNNGVSFLPPAATSRQEKYLLASYPRSGNTLIRNLLHNLTGVWTGSDTAVSRTLGWR